MSITITNKNIGLIIQEANEKLEKATAMRSDIECCFVYEGEIVDVNKHSSKEIKEKVLKILEKNKNEIGRGLT